jgi:hypothetical protein
LDAEDVKIQGVIRDSEEDHEEVTLELENKVSRLGDEVEDVIQDDSIVPDPPEHLRQRRGPIRAARGCSLKALESLEDDDERRYKDTLFEVRKRLCEPETHRLHYPDRVETADPKNRQEALNSPAYEHWIQAEKEELIAIKSMNVWSLVDRTKDMRVIQSS